MTLSTTQLQRLRPMLDAQSDERPEIQQLATHNQSLSHETPSDANDVETAKSSNVIGNTLNEALLVRTE